MHKLRPQIKLGLVLFAAIIVAVRCGQLDNPKTGASLTVPTPTLNSVFNIEVSTIYESGTDTDNPEIPQGPTCNVVSTSGSTQNCSTISIPEAELYFGKVKIKANINNLNRCAVFTFQPYYYQMSILNDFIPFTTDGTFTALDCRDGTNANCYSGPATKLVPSFPINKGVYYLPTSSRSSFDWAIDSANKIRQDSKYDPGDKWAANDLFSSYRSQFFLDYVPNSMVDYTFTCEDIYNDTQYTAVMKLAVEPGVLGYQHPHWVASSTVPTTTTTSSSSSTTTTTTTTNPEIFRLSVSTIEDSFASSQGTPCDVTVTSGNIDCSVPVPEAQLYYGDLKLELTQLNPLLCPRLVFEPYYYRMSNQVNFVPSTGNSNYFPYLVPSDPTAATGWDCRQGLGVIQCYSGAARQLVPNFPQVTDLLYSINPATPSLSWTIDSAFKISQTENYAPGNRWTTNDLVARGVSQTDYVANSMHDYYFKCVDNYGAATYSAKLVISPAEGTDRQYLNWGVTTTTTTTSTTSTSTTSTTTTTTTTTNPQLYQVQVATIFESDTSNTPNPVSPDTDPSINCKPTKTDPSTVTCKFTVSEAQLYYSKLKLSVSVTNPNLCPLFTFTPYYYQMSTSATFKPLKANSSYTAIDCSGATSPLPLGCYSGPATQLISNFPDSKNLVSFSAVDPNPTWMISSAHSVLQSQNYDPGNTWTSNDLATPASGPSFTPKPDYVNNSMQGYVFQCSDWLGNATNVMNMTIVIDQGVAYDFLNWRGAAP